MHAATIWPRSEELLPRGERVDIIYAAGRHDDEERHAEQRVVDAHAGVGDEDGRPAEQLDAGDLDDEGHAEAREDGDTAQARNGGYVNAALGGVVDDEDGRPAEQLDAGDLDDEGHAEAREDGDTAQARNGGYVNAALGGVVDGTPCVRELLRDRNA